MSSCGTTLCHKDITMEITEVNSEKKRLKKF